MNALIIGAGEIGTALSKVLNINVVDKHIEENGKYGPGIGGILHICFPPSDEFVSEVKRYQKMYEPKYTIIHSTVPVGTSRKCNAMHSPVRGMHPNLESGLRTFTKFIGGEQASEVADHFRRAGMKVYLFDKPETTELMKIQSTTFYLACIEYVKETKRLCEKYDAPFEAWTLWTETYNDGFTKLGHPEYTRPNLVPIMKEPGGHCVLQNIELLESEFTKFLKTL